MLEDILFVSLPSDRTASGSLPPPSLAELWQLQQAFLCFLVSSCSQIPNYTSFTGPLGEAKQKLVGPSVSVSEALGQWSLPSLFLSSQGRSHRQR